jgi:hypothetical protein
LQQLLFFTFTVNPVSVIKTGIPCAHILTEKTCFIHGKNLLSIKGSCSLCREPVFKTRRLLHAPCSTLYGIAVFDIVLEKVIVIS